MGNEICNVEQTIISSISFYHTTRSFQFINTCETHNKTKVLIPQFFKVIYLYVQQNLLQMNSW
jgi:hypothetical protein